VRIAGSPIFSGVIDRMAQANLRRLLRSDTPNGQPA